MSSIISKLAGVENKIIGKLRAGTEWESENEEKIFAQAGTGRYGNACHYNILKNTAYIGSPDRQSDLIYQAVNAAVKNRASVLVFDTLNPGELYNRYAARLLNKGYDVAVMDLMCGEEDYAGHMLTSYMGARKVSWDMCGGRYVDVYTLAQQMLGLSDDRCTMIESYAYDLLASAASYLNFMDKPGKDSFVKKLCDIVADRNFVQILRANYEECTKNQHIKQNTACWQIFQAAEASVQAEALGFLRMKVRQFSNCMDTFNPENGRGFVLRDMLEKKTALFVIMNPESAKERACCVIGRMFAQLSNLAWTVSAEDRKIITILQLAKGMDGLINFGGVDRMVGQGCLKQAGFGICVAAGSVTELEKYCTIDGGLRNQCGTIVFDMPLCEDDLDILYAKFNPIARAHLLEKNGQGNCLMVTASGFRNPVYAEK